MNVVWLLLVVVSVVAAALGGRLELVSTAVLDSARSASTSCSACSAP